MIDFRVSIHDSVDGVWGLPVADVYCIAIYRDFGM